MRKPSDSVDIGATKHDNLRKSRTKRSFWASNMSRLHALAFLWRRRDMGEAATRIIFEGFQKCTNVVLRGTHVSANGVEIRFAWQALSCCLFLATCKMSGRCHVVTTCKSHRERVILNGRGGIWCRSAVCGMLFCVASAVFRTLYTVHFTLHTLHWTLHTPHLTLHTPHFTPCTLLFKLYTSPSTLHTLQFTLYTPNFTFYTPHSTLYTPHFTLYTFTLRTRHFTLHTPHFTSALYSLHFALHTLHFTLHTPRYKL